jgi:hypothetical protein
MGYKFVTVDAQVASQPPGLCGIAREMNSFHLFIIRVVDNKHAS